MSDSERVQYKFMIPAGLKRELETSANEARRSLSAEIIMRLYDSLSDLPVISEDPLANELSRLESERFSKSHHLREIAHRISVLDEDIEAIRSAMADRLAAVPQDESTSLGGLSVEVPDPNPEADPKELVAYVLGAHDDAEMKLRAEKANELLADHPDHVFIHVRDEFDMQAFPAKVALAYPRLIDASDKNPLPPPDEQ